jgi:hypothetical protein
MEMWADDHLKCWLFAFGGGVCIIGFFGFLPLGRVFLFAYGVGLSSLS